MSILANRRLYPALHFATGFFNAATLIPLLFVMPVLVYALITGRNSEGKFHRRCTAFYYGGLVAGLLSVVPGILLLSRGAG